MNHLESLYLHCLNEPVHNQQSLHLYDLFERDKNTFFNYALIIDIKTIKIYLKQEINQEEIHLYAINYFIEGEKINTFKNDREIDFNIQSSINNIIIIDTNETLFNENYCIKYNNEIIPIFQDTRPNSLLINYFTPNREIKTGAFYEKNQVTFRIWSPSAGRIDALVFDSNNQMINSNKSHTFQKIEFGFWELTLYENDFNENFSLEGLQYQFLVFAYGKARIALDPFAFSMSSFSPQQSDKIGKGIIVDFEKIIKNAPKGFKNSQILETENQLTAYEVHIRDFTIEPDIVEKEISGTFPGFEKKAKHISDLGFSHVQLMPVLNFYTVSELNKEYQDENTPEINYNWGYDPHHYFVPEGWFCTQPENPYNRIFELQDLIHHIHNLKMGVIFDVVYNHTYLVETLENMAPGWYYRYDENYRISGHTGAGPGLESRSPLSQKLIVESIVYLIQVFGIDGLRFDLLSFMDHSLLEKIRVIAGKNYNPENVNDFIMHGEGWVFSDLNTNSTEKNQNTAITKLNPPKPETHVALFNDTFRDAVMGYHKERGIMHGNNSSIVRLASGITGGCIDFNPGKTAVNSPDFYHPYHHFANQPFQNLNLLSIHDGFTLWDKIHISTFDETFEKQIQFAKMAAIMLFTSFGKVIWHGGDELLRSKPLSNFDKEKNRTAQAPDYHNINGIHLFHENSYCSPDFTNMFRWKNSNYSVDYMNFIKRLIQIRKNISFFKITDNQDLKKQFQFETPNNHQPNPCIFSSFEQLEYLDLIIENGTINTSMYITGEVHPKNCDANPSNNIFKIHFNEKGIGRFVFTKQQISLFDIGKWGENKCLKLKLVTSPGQWDYPEKSYTTDGNNSIYIQAVNENHQVTLNLNNCNEVVGAFYPEFVPLLISKINDLQNNTKYLIVHNFNSESVTIDLPYSSKKITPLIDSGLEYEILESSMTIKNIGSIILEVL